LASKRAARQAAQPPKTSNLKDHFNELLHCKRRSPEHRQDDHPCLQRSLAARAAGEFVVTAFANALQFWADNEPISDDEDRLLGEVSIEMPEEGMIELAVDAIEITARGIAITPVKMSKCRVKKKRRGNWSSRGKYEGFGHE
jgi:hypothetical protein